MGRFFDWLKRWGAVMLIFLTILQVLFFVGYSILYTVVYTDWNPDASVTRVELYQWISILILTVGMAYFLWQSLRAKPFGKLKNPNELFSYLALGVINNCIFMAKLCYYAYQVKTDWVDSDAAPSENTQNLTLLLYAMTYLCIVGVLLIIVFMSITAKPLRDYIFEEIFYEIGSNVNAV